MRPSTPALKSGPDSQGFVYVTEAETTVLRDADVGSTVRNPSAGPPWIVVNHALAAVSVARWPGRLFRVEILERAREQPRSYANYTRAVAVKVAAELPTLLLLGAHGEHIAEILGRIDTLTLDEAFALAAATEPSSSEIYATAWGKWLAEVDKHSVHLDADHRDTLQIRVGHTVSPVGYALSLVSSKMQNRAQRVSGPAALCVDAGGEAELLAPWQGATSALLHAAMAYGAPGLLSSQQTAALKSSWRTVIEGNAS